MLSSMHIISLVSLAFIVTIEGNHNVFTYNDGTDEHCCLVQLGENFCLAKPLTRTLIQVNRDCQRLNANDKTKTYLSKVVRRLLDETSNRVGDNLLIQLKDPLDKEILKQDLVCLASASNNIHLDKCYVVLADVDDKKPKRKARNGTIEELVVELKSNDNKKVRRVEASETIRIHHGHGLGVRQSFDLKLTEHKSTASQHRESWGWYRSHTKDICSQPVKYQKTCIPLNKQNIKYLKQIVDEEQTDDDDDDTDDENLESIISITKGSKLFCENNHKQTKLLGYYLQSEICFQTINQIYVEHKFTDFVSLTAKNHNRDILQFISNNTKLASEFEHDCNDQTTLGDLKKSLEKEVEAEDNDENSST